MVNDGRLLLILHLIRILFRGVSEMVQWWHESQGLRFGVLRRATANSQEAWYLPAEKGVWLWLNREGMGLLWGKEERYPMHPGMFAVCGGLKEGAWKFLRQPGACLVEVVMLSDAWLQSRLGSKPEALHPEFRNWLRGETDLAFCGLMGEWEKKLVESIDVAKQGSGIDLMMAEVRLLEWAALRMFQSRKMTTTGFCHRFKHANPVERALLFLQSNFHAPLDLTALAKKVGMAPHLLSRRVSQETGKTLQLHLRKFRIHHACEALSSGKKSITEVSLDVGYSSLSHFAQAFRAEIGCSPSKWVRDKSRV